MKKLMTVVGAVTIFAIAPNAVEGQVYLGPEVAYHDDFDFGVGAVVEFGLPSITPGMGFWGDWVIYFPGDNVDYFEFNANLTYDFPLEDASAVPFVIGGLNIGRWSYDTGDVDPGFDEDGSNTELGLNLGGGVKFQAGSFTPRVGIRVTIADNTGIVAFASVPFRLAGSN
jgi:opacity protein-like surface antigen